MIKAVIRSEQHRFRTDARETVSWTHWNLYVYDGDLLINKDDCRDWFSLARSAVQRVIRYRDMKNRGVKLRYWWDLVDEAADA